MNSYLSRPLMLIGFFLIASCTKTLGIDRTDTTRELNDGSLTIGDELKISFFVDDRIDSHDYIVSRGDILRVDVSAEQLFSREAVLVMPDGKISLPLIGLMAVSGHTIKEITSLVNFKYAEIGGLRNPRVSVELEEGQNRLHNFLTTIFKQSDQGGLRFIISNNDIDLPYIKPINPLSHSFDEIRHVILSAYNKEFGDKLIVTVNLNALYKENQFYIIGEVKSAGAFPLTKGLNIINAVAIAGGFTYRADKDTFDIKKSGGTAENKWSVAGSNVVVLPGDIIRINERFF